jgi:hypothetical protein
MGFQVNSQEKKDSQMLFHVLLFQWSEDHEPEIKSEIMALFQALPDKIDGLESIDIRDLIMTTDEFDTVVIQRYSSAEALEQYQIHPDHLRIVEIAPLAISKMSKFDYWN